MPHGICTLSIVPCRKEASDPSEMVTQLLFGETFELLDVQEKWTKVRLDADGYECWVDNKQITRLDDEEYTSIASLPLFRSTSVMALITSADQEFLVPFGSTIHGLHGNEFQIAGTNYQYDGMAVDTRIERRQTIPLLAKLLLNCPYLWGGRSPAGIDCSGFTQVVFSLAGFQLPRDAYQQAEQGQRVELNDSTPCDLAFFHNDKGRITHVGIILDDLNIIHASGKVRIDDLTSEGIRTEDGEITHKLAHISRI